LLRSAAAQLDRDQPVANFARLADLFAARLDRSEFYALLLASFAISSLLLTAIGLYGVIALLVAQRRREFGIRLSIGAAPRRIFLLVLRQSLQLAALGLAVGIALTFAGTRLLRALLYGVDPVDPLLLGGCALVVVIIAVVAASAPAHSAARLDPARVIRADT
jgi:ABC-type antimicrobial peptide transport system permease subunit